MKNLIKISFVFAVAIMILASCSKDQKCVNWLDGEWKITKLEVTDSTGATVDLIAQAAAFGLTVSGRMLFDKYSVKKDESGTGTSYLSTKGNLFGQPIDETDTTSYSYKIQDDCETVWIKEDGSSSPYTSDIIESSKKKMIISEYDETEKSTTKITIEKN